MKTQHTPGPWNLQTQSTFDSCGIKAEVTLPGSKEKGWLTIAECNYDRMIDAISAIYGDSVEDIKNEIDAMDSDFLKLKTRLMALNNAIECLMQEGYDFTASELIEIRDEIKDQLKDLQFDQETNPLPFPEK